MPLYPTGDAQLYTIDDEQLYTIDDLLMQQRWFTCGDQLDLRITALGVRASQMTLHCHPRAAPVLRALDETLLERYRASLLMIPKFFARDQLCALWAGDLALLERYLASLLMLPNIAARDKLCALWAGDLALLERYRASLNVAAPLFSNVFARFAAAALVRKFGN